jgi:hypothetical protein
MFLKTAGGSLKVAAVGEKVDLKPDSLVIVLVNPASRIPEPATETEAATPEGIIGE